MTSINLKDRWTLTVLGENVYNIPETPIETKVPSTVYSTLLEKNLIPDPFYRDNELDATKLMANDFVYETEFSLQNADREADRLFLRFKGIDTLADIWLGRKPSSRGASADTEAKNPSCCEDEADGRKLLGTANNMNRVWEYDIKPNPTIENVKSGVAAYKASGADYMITIGGGSSMDTGKAIGIIINNPEFEDVRSLEGVAPTKNKTVFTIAVPTTAGTAAEATINYVITDVEKKRKFVCVDVNDIPDIAIVDPEMMSSMPKSLTAATGMDALTHAIEGYTTKAAWRLADCLNLEAIRLISGNLRGAVENTTEGREGMALGQFVTGMAFSNVGLGIAHSMAHTLGAVYDTPHGVACAMMLPIVMEYNAEMTGEKFKDIAEAMGVDTTGMSQDEYRKAAVAAVRQLSEDVGIPSRLEALKEEDLDFLAESAFADACCPGNPKDTSVEDLKELFRKLM